MSTQESNQAPRDEDKDPADKVQDQPELEDAKTDQERIRVDRSGTTQPEDAAVKANERRGAPRHRN